MEDCNRCKIFMDIISIMNDSLRMYSRLLQTKRFDLLIYTHREGRPEIINRYRLEIQHMEINLMNRQTTLAQVYCDYGDHLVNDHDEEDDD